MESGNRPEKFRDEIALGSSFDDLLYDITEPKFPVSVQTDGRTLWVNVGPVCVLRICRITNLRTEPWVDPAS